MYIYIYEKVLVYQALSWAQSRAKALNGATMIYSTLLYSSKILLYSTMLYYTLIYYAIILYTILYYTILYFALIYYTVIYYIITYCIILNHTIPNTVRHHRRHGRPRHRGGPAHPGHQRWNRNPRPQPHKFSKLGFLMYVG